MSSMVNRMTSSVAWEPDHRFLKESNISRFMTLHGLASYEELEAAWISDVEWFWSAAAQDLGMEWFEEPEVTLDRAGDAPWWRWFPGGRLNLVHNCVDRHAPGGTALIYEGEEGKVSTLTYGELSSLVSRIAGGLRSLGVRIGDRIGIYMPMVPEAIAACYAVAKIGALSVPLFSGFGPQAVATRLRDAGVKVLLAADGCLRRGRTIDMGAVAREAYETVAEVEHLVIYPRLGENDGWNRFLEVTPVEECQLVSADHPFLIAYTSGTTGKPKGSVHTHAGFPLKSATEIMYHCDQRADEILFWVTDLGWIMAPLTMTGAGMGGRPLLLYDGAPDYPAADRLSTLIERHHVGVFGVSPTLVRALAGRNDHGFGSPPASLRVLGSTGEPWNEGPWWWFFDTVGASRCPVVNLAGGTEAGSLLGVLPIRGIKPCSFTGPCVGVDATILDTEGRSVASETLGELAVRQPWPGRTKGLWRDDQRYVDTYWSRFAGIWIHGDWASRDVDGFWYLHGRSDDTINVAGKRVGPAEIESALVDEWSVLEAAAVGIPHPLKGETIWCFVVVRRESDQTEEQLRNVVATRLGKAFTPERIEIVSALPRTRNGKILRRALRATAIGEDAGDLSVMEDPEILHAIAEQISS